MENEKKPPCIVMVPCSGLGHLIPFVEFAKQLVLQNPDLHVTLLIPSLGSLSSSMEAILEALPPSIDFTLLPQVNLENHPQDFHPITLTQLRVSQSIPSLRHALSSLNSRYKLSALLVDQFTMEALDIAKLYNLLAYVFMTTSATLQSLCFSLPKWDQTYSGNFSGLSEPVKIPGCGVPLYPRDIPEPIMQGRTDEVYRIIIQICKRFHFVDGVLVNTFIDLEEGPIRALQEPENADEPYPHIYPVGPIIRNGSDVRVNGSECLRWLDNQPAKSVLYVCFGSSGTLCQDQFNELAFGLEFSGHKFLWAVRVPSNLANADFYNAQHEDPLNYLPSGFLERTKEHGLVVASWAPQVEILGHGSIGGFLTHCGWNSILESIVSGVPMIVWPLFAEQRMNAVMLTDEIKIAVRPKANEIGIVERKEISEVVKRQMEGEEGKGIRRRIEDLKKASIAALSEGGSSHGTITSLVLKWKTLSGAT